MFCLYVFVFMFCVINFVTNLLLWLTRCDEFLVVICELTSSSCYEFICFCLSNITTWNAHCLLINWLLIWIFVKPGLDVWICNGWNGRMYAFDCRSCTQAKPKNSRSQTKWRVLVGTTRFENTGKFEPQKNHLQTFNISIQLIKFRNKQNFNSIKKTVFQWWNPKSLVSIWNFVMHNQKTEKNCKL